MILTICLLIALTLVAALALARHLSPPLLRFQLSSNGPAGFGYRMAWLAVRTREPGQVAQVMGFTTGQLANWQTGIGTVYDRRLGESFVYITPPVDGWTFVVGLALPQPMGRGFVDKCTPLLLDLGQAFPEAQYFLCYPPLDCFAWARCAEGRLIRAFAIGDEGVIWNKGRLTREERSLDLAVLAARSARQGRNEEPTVLPRPTEAHLMSIARGWGVDPTTLGTANVQHHVEPGPGFVCQAPLAWRPQRLKRVG